MPSYYNSYGYPYNGVGAAYYTPYAQQPVQPVSYSMSGVQQNPQYMIQVDGEMAARAWQPPANLPPRTLIPLWDYDGQHVYFKSTDEYGRMNPMRKGMVIFEDEQQNLPQGQSQQQSGEIRQGNQSGQQGVSGGGQSIELPDMTRFVTKDDLESFKADLRSMFTAQAQSHQSGQSGTNQGNQNGNNSRNSRGDNR